MERLALDRWASPWLRNQHVARYQWAAGFVRGRRALDAACGAGYGSRMLLEAGAAHVTSADRSLEAFDACRRSGGEGPLALVRADAARLPLASSTIDLYTCFETIEHVERDRELLEEARRVLRPGGMLLCSTPNRELLSPGNTIADRPANPYHVREYSISEFRELLEHVFGEVELYGQTWFGSGHQERLARVGRRGNLYAVRLHQLRNILGLPWERAARHEPRLLARAPSGQVPEVVIGLCRT